MGFLKGIGGYIHIELDDCFALYCTYETKPQKNERRDCCAAQRKRSPEKTVAPTRDALR